MLKQCTGWVAQCPKTSQNQYLSAIVFAKPTGKWVFNT